jgi:hypothetical protein
MISLSSRIVRLPVEIKPRHVLKFQAAHDAVGFALDNGIRGEESHDLIILGQLVGVPHPPILGFQLFPATRLGVDFDQSSSASFFSEIVDFFLLSQPGWAGDQGTAMPR